MPGTKGQGEGKAKGEGTGKGKAFTVAMVRAALKAAAADPEAKGMRSDAGQAGLYLRTRAGGCEWAFLFTSPVTGRRRRLSIGSASVLPLADARAAAAGHLRTVTRGGDPIEQRQQAVAARQAEQAASATVGDAAEAYLEDYGRRVFEGVNGSGRRRGSKRSGLESARRRLASLPPALLRTPLAALTPDTINRWMRDKASTPAEANRTLSVLRSCLSLAVDKGMGGLVRNPASHADVVSYREKGVRRALTGDELGRLGRALDDAEKAGTVHPSVILAVRLLALTGLRRSELIAAGGKVNRGQREGLRWGDVDLGAGTLVLADSKTGRSVRVLGQAALDLLARVRPADAGEDDAVVPGERSGQAFVGIDGPRRRLWKAAGLKATAAGRVDLHSLRHTFASIGAGLDSGRWIGHVSRLLGHGYQGRSITERYISDNPAALRPAADAVAGEIARLMGRGVAG